jgi:hypothetical protein
MSADLGPKQEGSTRSDGPARWPTLGVRRSVEMKVEPDQLPPFPFRAQEREMQSRAREARSAA